MQAGHAHVAHDCTSETTLSQRESGLLNPSIHELCHAARQAVQVEKVLGCEQAPKIRCCLIEQDLHSATTAYRLLMRRSMQQVKVAYHFDIGRRPKNSAAICTISLTTENELPVEPYILDWNRQASSQEWSGASFAYKLYLQKIRIGILNAFMLHMGALYNVALVSWGKKFCWADAQLDCTEQNHTLTSNDTFENVSTLSKQLYCTHAQLYAGSSRH